MHASYVDERNRRVAKFSSGNHASVLLQGNDQTTDLKSAAGNIAIPVSKYAMFQPQNAAKISESSTRSPNPAEKHMAMLRQQKLQSNNVVPAMGATCPPRTSSAVEGLHRRHTGVTNASTTNTAVASPYATSSSAVAQEQQQLLKAKKDTRYKYAQQAEQSIRQVR